MSELTSHMTFVMTPPLEKTLTSSAQPCASITERSGATNCRQGKCSSQIRFLHHFDDFSTPAVPKTPGDLIDYLQANNDFIEARNSRIARSLG